MEQVIPYTQSELEERNWTFNIAEVDDPFVQVSKIVDIITNGQGNVLPDEGYKGMAEVSFNVNVPPQINTTISNVMPSFDLSVGDVFVRIGAPGVGARYSKTWTSTDNVTSIFIALQNSTGGTIIRSAEIKLSENAALFTLHEKDVEITENGEYTHEPDTDYVGLSKFTVKVNVPSFDIVTTARINKWTSIGSPKGQPFYQCEREGKIVNVFKVGANDKIKNIFIPLEYKPLLQPVDMFIIPIEYEE